MTRGQISLSLEVISELRPVEIWGAARRAREGQVPGLQGGNQLIMFGEGPKASVAEAEPWGSVGWERGQRRGR